MIIDEIHRSNKHQTWMDDVMKLFLTILLLPISMILAEEVTAQSAHSGSVVQEAPLPAGHERASATPSPALQQQQVRYRYHRSSYQPRTHRRYQTWQSPSQRGWNQWEMNPWCNPYPKYYGAFHSSHFSNVGIPHGDIGLRGNGIYWTPW